LMTHDGAECVATLLADSSTVIITGSLVAAWGRRQREG
jgi:hypothetical protein